MKSIFFTNTKLGLFVISGLIFLILVLYMIGKNKNLFGSNFKLKARFENVQGLKSGNNIRYAGIDIGTVKTIRIINDTTMEVEMIIENKLKNIIRKNAIVSIGTDGLVGNKVVNIMAMKSYADFAENNDILPSKKPVDTDEMLRILSKTNSEVSEIAGQLKKTINKINNSNAIWEIMNDKSLPVELKKTIGNLDHASNNINETSLHIKSITAHISEGKGTIGKLIYDSSLSENISTTIENIKSAGDKIDNLSNDLNLAITTLNDEMQNGKGTINRLLKDSCMSANLKYSLQNIEKGTKGFSENMEALKNSFLFRGYFRKINKRGNKDQEF